MRESPVYFLDIPFEERLKILVINYGKFEKKKRKLKEAILRIQKRLGGLETKKCNTFYQKIIYPECFGILLKYYDKLYLKGFMAGKL